MTKLIPVGNHNVFAKGLIGSYRASVSVSSYLGEVSASNSELGYGLGGGLLINESGGTSLFLDVTYHHITYDGDDIDELPHLHGRRLVQDQPVRLGIGNAPAIGVSDE